MIWAVTDTLASSSQDSKPGNKYREQNSYFDHFWSMSTHFNHCDFDWQFKTCLMKSLSQSKFSGNLWNYGHVITTNFCTCSQTHSTAGVTRAKFYDDILLLVITRKKPHNNSWVIRPLCNFTSVFLASVLQIQTPFNREEIKNWRTTRQNFKPIFSRLITLYNNVMNAQTFPSTFDFYKSKLSNERPQTHPQDKIEADSI